MKLSPAKSFVWEQLGFEPTGKEQELYLQSEAQVKLLSGGDQSGKSYCSVIDATGIIYASPKPMLVWLVGQTYDRSMREYDYFLRFFGMLGMVKYASNSRADRERFIVLHDGTLIKTKSVADARRIIQEAPDLIIVCEAGQVDLDAYERLRARIAASAGRMIMSGTMEGSVSWYADLFDRWWNSTTHEQAFPLPTWTNHHLFPGGYWNPEIQKFLAAVGEEVFMERYGGIPRKPSGLVFGNYFNPMKHIGMPDGSDVQYLPGLDVYLAIDPGFSKGVYAVEACQFYPTNPTLRVFDELYVQDTYNADVVELCQMREWWKDVKGGAIDRQASFSQQAEPAPVRHWHNAGVPLHYASERIPIQFGIDRMRSFFVPDRLTGLPRMIISRERCPGFLSELAVGASPITRRRQYYRWKLDPSNQIMGKVPIDEANHAIKAVTYLIWDKYGPLEAQGNRSAKVQKIRRSRR